jgi:hypothetical protein
MINMDEIMSLIQSFYQFAIFSFERIKRLSLVYNNQSDLPNIFSVIENLEINFFNSYNEKIALTKIFFIIFLIISFAIFFIKLTGMIIRFSLFLLMIIGLISIWHIIPVTNDQNLLDRSFDNWV